MILDRRSFLTGLGAGLVLAQLPRVASAAPTVTGFDPHVLVHIALDGTTTIFCHRSEMGQGIRSSLPVLIGDEIGADPARVVVVQADGDKKYGDQNTDGSTSIRKQYDYLRQAGATARMMLTAAAAKRWKVKPETCTTANHQVIHSASKRTLAFADVVADAAKLPVPKKVTYRPFSELVNVTSENLPLIDGEAHVTGTSHYGADIRLPNMLTAMIARPPVVGGKLVTYDATAANRVPGVKRIVEMPQPKPPWLFQPWGGVAVIADTTWAAMKGRAALKLEWDHGANATYDSIAYREQLLGSVRADGTKAREVGDIDKAFSAAKKTVEAEYVVPHLSHMQMEPLVAVAHMHDGICEVWAPTQNPQENRTDVAKLLGISEDKVTIHVTLLGGAFGRKSKSDFVVEAAYLASQLEGTPVRVQWTREDDVKHGYYNAVNAQRLRAALDEYEYRDGLASPHSVHADRGHVR
ncbi:MAG: molybdopterin-dependent oxidoreductase [Kofleriaceae bacterium]